MKQHITKKQWNEITEEQQEKFVSVVEPNDSAYIGESGCSECGRNCLPSVGQMIEFLDEHTCFNTWSSECKTQVVDGGYLLGQKVKNWLVSVHLKDKNINKTNSKLCDSLWEAVEAVMEILKEEE